MFVYLIKQHNNEIPILSLVRTRIRGTYRNVFLYHLVYLLTAVHCINHKTPITVADPRGGQGEHESPLKYGLPPLI